MADKMSAWLDKLTSISTFHLVDREDTVGTLGACILSKLHQIREHLIVRLNQFILRPSWTIVAEESQFVDGLKSSRSEFAVATDGHLHLSLIMLV